MFLPVPRRRPTGARSASSSRDAANVSDSYGAFIEQYDERAQEISKKYQDKLGGLKFAGVCSVCFPDPGEFVREYKSSYVTNLFDDLGLQFPGQPDNPEDGHAEYVAFERISTSSVTPTSLSTASNSTVP